MELLIIKNGHVFARANDENSLAEDTYEFRTVNDSDMPAYPTEDAGKGKYYELDYVDDTLVWIQKDRPLTTEERMEEMQSEIDKMNNAWKIGEAVVKGDRRTFGGYWYTCLQAHTTQADWTPDLTPALWIKDPE